MAETSEVIQQEVDSISCDHDYHIKEPSVSTPLIRFKCKICDYIYQDFNITRDHIIEQHFEGKDIPESFLSGYMDQWNECVQCNSKFNQYVNFEHHVCVEDNNRNKSSDPLAKNRVVICVFQCLLCKLLCLSKLELFTHIRSDEHIAGKYLRKKGNFMKALYKCRDCNLIVENLSIYEAHICCEGKAKFKQLYCRKCKKPYCRYEDRMCSHKKYGKSKTICMHQCNNCYKLYYNEATLIYHIENHCKDVELIVCTKCGKGSNKVKSKNDLCIHLKEEINVNNVGSEITKVSDALQCDACLKVYCNEIMLAEHECAGIIVYDNKVGKTSRFVVSTKKRSNEENEISTSNKRQKLNESVPMIKPTVNNDKPVTNISTKPATNISTKPSTNAIKIHQCQLCNILKINKSDIKEHIKNDHHEKCMNLPIIRSLYMCSTCKLMTLHETVLKEHICTTGSVTLTSYYCTICKIKIIGMDDTMTHSKDKHSNTTTLSYQKNEIQFQQCKTCFKLFSNLETWQKHVNSECKSLFICHVCNSAFKNGDTLCMHILHKVGLLNKDKKTTAKTLFQMEQCYSCLEILYSSTELNEHSCSKIKTTNNIAQIQHKEPDTTEIIPEKTALNLKLKSVFQCLLCYKIELSRRDFDNHIKRHKECPTRASQERYCRLLHRCNICKINFHKYKQFNLHECVTDGKIKKIFYKCTLCPFELPSKDHLIQHYNDKHDNNDSHLINSAIRKELYWSQCQKCYNMFKRSHDLIRHVKECRAVLFESNGNNDSNIDPLECTMEEESDDSMNVEIVENTSDEPSTSNPDTNIIYIFQCLICFICKPNKTDLEYHIKTHKNCHSLPSYDQLIRTVNQCTICKLILLQHNLFQCHQCCFDGRVKKLNYSCSLCQTNFTNKEALINHYYDHHKDHTISTSDLKMFETYWPQCKKCYKLFSNNSYLAKHYKSNKCRAIQNLCNYCGLTFNQKIQLEDHQKNVCIYKVVNDDLLREDGENVEKSVKEPNSVESTSQITPTLTRGERMLQLFQCLTCSMCKSSKPEMKEHISTTHGTVHLYDSMMRTVKQCDYCKVILIDEILWKYHECSISKTVKKVWYACKFNCAGKFFNKIQLFLHFKSKHNIMELNSIKSIKKFEKLMLQCKKCYQLFDNRLLLMHHVNCECNNLEIACVHCGKRFETKDYLEQHLNACKLRNNDVPNEIITRYENLSTLDYMDLGTGRQGMDESLIVDKPIEPKTTAKEPEKFPGLKILRIHQCLICFQCKTKRNVIEAHIKTHEKCKTLSSFDSVIKYLYQCTNCRLILIHENLFKFHGCTFDGRVKQIWLPCSFCNSKFVTRGELISHNKIKHNHHELHLLNCNNKREVQYLFQCEKCFKTFQLEKSLKTHMRNTCKILEYACYYCELRFDTNNNLEYHKKNTCRFKRINAGNVINTTNEDDSVEHCDIEQDLDDTTQSDSTVQRITESTSCNTGRVIESIPSIRRVIATRQNSNLNMKVKNTPSTSNVPKMKVTLRNSNVRTKEKVAAQNKKKDIELNAKNRYVEYLSQCLVCCITDPSRDKIREHLKVHNECKSVASLDILIRSICQCSNCKLKQIFQNSLENHICSSDGSIKHAWFVCIICDVKYPLKKDLIKHCMDKHKNCDINELNKIKPKELHSFQCEDCFKIFKKKAAYTRHEKEEKCIRYKSHFCIKCDIRFSTQGDLQFHVDNDCTFESATNDTPETDVNIMLYPSELCVVKNESDEEISVNIEDPLNIPNFEYVNCESGGSIGVQLPFENVTIKEEHEN